MTNHGLEDIYRTLRRIERLVTVIAGIMAVSVGLGVAYVAYWEVARTWGDKWGLGVGAIVFMVEMGATAYYALRE